MNLEDTEYALNAVVSAIDRLTAAVDRQTDQLEKTLVRIEKAAYYTGARAENISQED